MTISQSKRKEVESMNQFSSVNRTMASFCFHVANVGHNFNKFCLQTQRKQAEEQLRKIKQQEALAESQIEQLKKALQLPPQPQPQPQPQSQAHPQPPNNPSLPLNNPICKAHEDIQTIAFEHFTNEFKPTILSRYPTAPADKVKKVIEQKWNSIDPAKKELYIKKVMRKIESEKMKQKLQETSSQFQPQTETKPQTQEQQQHEEVLVKQQAQQQEPEPREDKFNQFLNRVNQNVKVMQEEHRKHEQQHAKNIAMQQEPSQTQQHQREEETETQKMQEQSG